MSCRYLIYYREPYLLMLLGINADHVLNKWYVFKFQVEELEE
jgi:hypothetical protein